MLCVLKQFDVISNGSILQKLRTQGKTVILHLSVMLIAAQLTFLIGVDRTTPITGCRVTALLLQYFLLSAFMVCEVGLSHRLRI
jgi:hypothetical protein